MSQYGLFPFIIMMDITVQKGISLAFLYRCIITVCLPAIPTWGTSSQRIRTAKTYVHLLWVYLSEMYEKVFKNKNVVLLPIAAPSCHLTFLGDNQSERETSRGAPLRTMKSEESENAQAQQRAHLHTCLRDMVSSSPHLWGTFVLDVLSSADCPPHFRASTSSASVATA